MFCRTIRQNIRMSLLFVAHAKGGCPIIDVSIFVLRKAFRIASYLATPL
jgi:hypothetical protein